MMVILYRSIFAVRRVLRKIFGPKRYEVTGEWRKLHKDEAFIIKILTK